MDKWIRTVTKKRKNNKSSIINNQSAAKRPKAPQIIVRQAGRNVSRKEAHDKANVGFVPEYKLPWIEKSGWTRKYEEGWERIFGKKRKPA